MRKKYLIKQPSAQALLRQDSSTHFNHSICVEYKQRSSQQRDIKIDKTRLKTDWPTIDTEYSKADSIGKLKTLRTLKKKDSAKQFRKPQYFFPSNKQNSKQGLYNSNRFTFNEFRDHQIKEPQVKPQLDLTIAATRNSQAKHLPYKSIEKLKIDKYRFCNSKPKDEKDVNSSIQMKPPIFHRSGKEQQLDTSERKPELRQQDLQIQEQIGAGTFGKVFRAQILSSGDTVALKRVQQDKKYKTRELQIVKMLSSPFIIKTLGTFVTDDGKCEWLNIVMDAYHQNFFQLMRMQRVAGLDAKLYVYQMLRGLNYMHSLGVCHRDLKPQNMLVKGKRLVICDFGSAKVLSAGEQNISYICSRCYRAPELIFEATDYTTQIDMWSLGCILLEMLNGRPLFIADSSLNHILEVIKVLGTPSKQEVRAMNPAYEINEYDLPKIKGCSFRKMFPQADDQLISLIQRLVCYSPTRRLTALEALKHPYFEELREEKAQKWLSQLPAYQELFQFQKGEVPEGAKKQLVPHWWRKR